MLSPAVSPEPPPEPGHPAESRLARLGPAAAAAGAFALHAACWERYGVFRDELYFMACGERLSAGYVDQPPGIAVVARIAHALFGTWVPGVRLFAWLAIAAVVYLAGRLAGRLSSESGPAATIGAIATFACLELHGTGHALSMNAFLPLLMLAAVHVILRVVQGGDRRLWLAAGGLCGLAVLFKYDAAPLSLALLAGLLATPARRALRSPWALAGAALGLLMVLPNFLWQATHGFPFVELVRNGVGFKNAPMGPLQLLGNVLLEANPGNAPIWLGGLGWLLLARDARDARFAGVGGLIHLAALALGHAKPYYVTPLLPIFLGAGGAAFAALVRSQSTRWIYCGALAASALVFAPMAIPLLPVETYVAYQRLLGMQVAPRERGSQGMLPQHYGDQLGWRELVAAVARVYASLPPGERERAVVYAGNYGAAAAVDILGPEARLPRGLAISGHNQYWFWGVPRGRGDPVIFIGGPNDRCGPFRDQVLGEQLPWAPYLMPYENGHTIWVCRSPTEHLTALPPRLRHFD